MVPLLVGTVTSRFAPARFVKSFGRNGLRGVKIAGVSSDRVKSYFSG